MLFHFREKLAMLVAVQKEVEGVESSDLSEQF